MSVVLNFVSIMSLNISKCAVAPIIIKACYQQSINGLQLKGSDCEKNDKCQGFRIHGSGGGDGDETRNLENGKNCEVGIRSKGTQTDYRESETQTSPWEAPYKLMSTTNENLEILSLANSTWGNGLPAGMHEAKIINRMRMKKAWLEVLPPMDTPSNMKTWEAITSAIEANEWAFREAEIQFIMDSRMELMEQINENRTRAKEELAGERIKRLAKRLGQQRDKQIHNIRGKFLRDVRKLNRKHRRSSSASYKIHRSDIIARYANPTSQIYAPEMRFGFKAEGRHEILDKSLLPDTYVERAVRVDDSTKKWLPTDEELRELRSISRPEELCARRTRWTDEKLRKLHADLKSIRLNDTRNTKKDKMTLLKRKFKVPPLPATPLKRGGDNRDNYWENSSLFIQKITRGRAVQCMMYEGRDRCRELIEELRSTHSLRDSEKAPGRNDEMKIIAQTREQNERLMRDNRLSEILDSLEGMTVAGMLDMLSKEEIRLREERKAHAMSLLAERERNRREAEESGRRQLERNRRRELDEMFRQMVKVNQDTVEAYLEDIIKEGIEWVSENEARQYVEELADKIDASTTKTVENETDKIGDEEMIADMVHNFLLPEVDKQITRRKIRDRQQAYIREAHVAIYNEMMNLKSTEKFQETNEISEISSNEDNYDETEEEEDENVPASEEDIEIYNEIMKLTSKEKLQDSREYFNFHEEPRESIEFITEKNKSTSESEFDD